MKKKLKQIIFTIAVILIILTFGYGQVYGFVNITTGDRFGGTHVTQTAEAGDIVVIPDAVEQGGAVYETITLDFAYTPGQVKEKWIENGSKQEDHWAYIEVGGVKYFLVALTPIFGLPGDYVKITVDDGSEVTDYTCIIMDAKDIWVDSAYEYEGITYGHLIGGKCNIIEVVSELRGVSSNYEVIASTGILDQFNDVTQIQNGGSYLENPDGPTGFTASGSSSNDEFLESDTFTGAVGVVFRNLWCFMAASFENFVQDTDKLVTVLYSWKE